MEYVVLLSVPGLRQSDLVHMPQLSKLVRNGDRADLVPSFPAVTCPVQANMTTGVLPNEHGVVANGFFWRERGEVEMWTSANDCVLQPQLWDILRQHNPELTSAVWFPLHSKHCGADYVCTPAPIHNPDGSESLWCYSRPEKFYEELVEELGHFPLQHFWGPMANIKSNAWIVSSAVRAAEKFRPNLFYIYLSHCDNAAQKFGPDSPEAIQATIDLDIELGRLIEGFSAAYAGENPLWLVASEYVISPVDQVCYPNRALREAGLLSVNETDDGELLDINSSAAWALVDHQFAHIFVRDSEEDTIKCTRKVLEHLPGVAEVLTRAELTKIDLNHRRSGDLVVVSEPNSWLAYYWWLNDRNAPSFARTVDIHRKPGYDPVELFWDSIAKGIPLDASLVKGSHGAPALDPSQRGVLLCSERGVYVERPLADTDVADITLRQFGI